MKKALTLFLFLMLVLMCNQPAQSAVPPGVDYGTTFTPQGSGIRVTSRLMAPAMAGHVYTIDTHVKNPAGQELNHWVTNSQVAITGFANTFYMNAAQGTYSVTVAYSLYCPKGQYTTTTTKTHSVLVGTSHICTALTNAPCTPAGLGFKSCTYSEITPCPVNCAVPGKLHLVVMGANAFPVSSYLFNLTWRVVDGVLDCGWNPFTTVDQRCSTCS